MCNPSPLDNLKEIKELIQANIFDAEVYAQNAPNEQHHLKILVVSDEFQGKTLIKQHRLVMESLKQRFAEDLHAIEIKTITKEKYFQVV